jgi:ribosomal protein S18 acetylase RimI-like enzyme
MNTDIFIRKATIEDIPILKQFEQGIIEAERPFCPILKPDPLYYYDLPEMLNNPLIDLIVAVVNDTPVACGYARIEQSKHYYIPEQYAYLGMMYVTPEHRGKKINAMIIDSLKKLVAQRGIKELWLEVFSSNHSAIKAYQKAGFEDHMIQMRMSCD